MKWVKHQGIEYRLDFLVCVKVDIDLPVFYQIKDIIVQNERVFFIGQNMETVCFDSHFNAFQVATMTKPCKLQVVEVCDLVYYRAFDIQMSYDKADHQLFVVPYCVMI